MSDTPDLFSYVSDFVAETRAQYIAAKSDGSVSLAEWSKLFFDATHRLVVAADNMPVSGADKKAAVLAAVGKLYDAVLAPIDIPYIPEFIETSTVDPALKQLMLQLVDGAIETFVSLRKS